MYGKPVIKSYSQKDMHGMRSAKRKPPGKRVDLLSRIARRRQKEYGG